MQFISWLIFVGVKFLFLVGGFAESSILQYEVRKEFGHLLRVIIPQDVGLTILKGNISVTYEYYYSSISACDDC